ncbi:MAG: transposase [Candidatus Thermoplasmatota archaeon]|nr:transposase [Candidatus Thermoplasmatota archaeon]
MVGVNRRMLVKGVVFRLDSELPPEAKVLLQDFRLAVDCAIRAGLQARVTSRNALNKLAYRGFRGDFPNMYSQHLVSSFEVAAIQVRHHDWRKKLQRKKACDRRTSRRLCRREGRREHNRIDYRFHQVADAVLRFADDNRSAIVLEDLKGIKHKKNKDLNRRLSLWPRRKLHSIIEYKAKWRGIPLMKVDPRYSSRTCPICGRRQDSRMGAVFECGCGWRLDRHINASLNLQHTAVSKGMEVARGSTVRPRRVPA